MKRALLIHDIYNSHDQGWYMTLRRNLEFLGFQIVSPIFPFPEDCNYDSWTRVIDREMGEVGVTGDKVHKYDIVIGHGFGAYFLLGALSRGFIESKQNYLIAPYLPHKQNNKSYEEIGLHFDDEFTKVMNNKIFTVNNTLVFYSSDDMYIALLAFQKLQQIIEVSWFLIKNAKHFTVGDTDDIPDVRIFIEEYVRNELLTKKEKLEKVKDEYQEFENVDNTNTKKEVARAKNGSVEVPKKFKTPKNSFYTLKSDVDNVIDTGSSIELSNYMKKEKRRNDFHKKQMIFLLEKTILIITIMLLVVGLGYVSYSAFLECCTAPTEKIAEPIMRNYLYIQNSGMLQSVLSRKNDDTKLYIPFDVLKTLKPDQYGYIISVFKNYIESTEGIMLTKEKEIIVMSVKIQTPISANLISRDILKVVGRKQKQKLFERNIENIQGRIIEKYSYRILSETISKTPIQLSETGDIQVYEAKTQNTNHETVLTVELESKESLRVTLPLSYLK